MASLTDIANQINNTLNQIQTNTANTAATVALVKADTGDLRTTLHTLDNDVQVGFANLSNGLAVVINEQQQTNQLLNFQIQQNETIICWLSNIADVLCRALHRLDTQVQLQTKMEEALEQLRAVSELVYATETIQLLKQRELQKRIDACCPEPEPEPEHCFDPCHAPTFEPPPSRPVDWKPLPIPKRPK